MAAHHLPRVGEIEFLNCLPLAWGLAQQDLSDVMTLVSGTPDVLSDALIAGELDVGPISLVEALSHLDEIVVLPEVAVGSDGPVQSVCLISKIPVSQLHDATISLGSTSRTSVVLARILLEQHLGIIARYRTDPPDLNQMLGHSDAAVLIGDPALKATLFAAPERGWEVLDLGLAWKEWTGLPMVFAVWAARRSFAGNRSAELGQVRRSFARALSMANDELRTVVYVAHAHSGLPADVLATYFAGLDFGLGARQLAGIQRFCELSGQGDVSDLAVLDPIFP